MRKPIIAAAMLVIVVIVLYACKHEVATPKNTTTPADSTGTGGVGPGADTGSNNRMVCFETEILPIFTSNCTSSGCHDVSSHAEGYILNDYNNIVKEGIRPGKPDNSEIYELITEEDPHKRMPLNQPALSATQVSLIRKWILEGAQNTTNCGTTCNTGLFTYSGAVKPIIDTYCKGCHADPAAATKPNLSTYNGIKAVAQQNGRLLGAINHKAGFKPMPQTGPKLKDCQIEQITKWVNAGAPNN